MVRTLHFESLVLQLAVQRPESASDRNSKASPRSTGVLISGGICGGWIGGHTTVVKGTNDSPLHEKK